MTPGGVLLPLLLLAGAASGVPAQNSLNDFIARCGGDANVVDIGGGRLGCRTSPAGAGASSMAGLGEAFMQLLRGLEADAQRRAAEQRARRELALQILQQHRAEALHRQDAARAQQLQEIEQRVSRSEALFKGFTGAGAQLGVKTRSGGALQMKMGRAAAPRPSEAPASAPAVPVNDDAGVTALRQAFEQLPLAEQLEILKEMREQQLPGDEHPPTLADAPRDVRLTDIHPVDFPEDMTPEQLSTSMETVFSRQLSGGTLDILRAAGPPPPDWVLNPDPDEPVDSCEAAMVIDSSLVDLRCASEGLVDPDRLRPVGQRHVSLTTTEPPEPIDKAWEREALEVIFRDQADRPMPRLPDEFDRAGSTAFKPDPSIVRLATRGGGAIRPEDRMAVLLDLAPDKWASYFVDPDRARQIDLTIDRVVARNRWEHAELEMLRWRQGIAEMYGEMTKYNPDPDPAVLLTIPPFVAKRDEISKKMADTRAENARISQFRLALDLYEALKVK